MNGESQLKEIDTLWLKEMDASLGVGAVVEMKLGGCELRSRTGNGEGTGTCSWPSEPNGKILQYNVYNTQNQTKGRQMLLSVLEPRKNGLLDR